MSEQTKLSEPHHPRPQWRSRTGFVLAALGSAVGLGNIWRFSYLCYEHGGGAFLIPYLIALIVVGIPLMILELGLGHKMRGSAPMSFAMVDRRWEWLGWWAVISAMFGIMLYYSAVIAWCLNYVFYSFDLSWGADTAEFFFNTFLNKSSGPGEIGDLRFPIVVALGFVWFFSWLIVFVGIQKGVERANKIFMPMLCGLVFILVLWSLNLEGAKEGLKVYLKPNFTHLAKPKIWIDAFSQIFFTLSLAFGIMITYASYLPRKINLVKSAIVICVGNCLFSIIAGFAVFGTLGYMAHTMDKPVAEVVTESIGLAFVAYPKAISLLPALSSLFGVIFFLTLVVAGLSSAVSLVEAFSAAIIDKFHSSRKEVVSWVCVIGFFGSIIFATRGGLFWIDIVDHFVTHYGLVVIGILECIVIGWLFKSKKLRDHISNVSGVKLHKFWDVCIRFITPTVLVFLLLNDLVKEVRIPYEGYPWAAIILIGRDWLIFTLIASVIIATRVWRRDLNQQESS